MEPSSPTFSFRKDLVHRRVQMGQRYLWVVKDPLARAFFYFTEREFAILKMLDGRRLSRIVSDCQKRFAPDYISAESIVRFLADAKRSSLISTSTSVTHLDHVDRALPHRSSSAKNLLAIRCPGINPDATLERVASSVRWLFSPITMWMVVVFVMAACGLVLANFEQFALDLSTAVSRSTAHWFALLVVVVGITKIIHELSHALACKVFGAECRELGIMFLVGIPCLYCDVSDAWMLKDRSKRIVISLAGMYVELILAGIAVFLWSICGPGIVRDVLVTVILTCSVSTLMFNGNPLLRYDGYFVVSDLLGVPNLSTQSSQLLSSHFRRFLWSQPKPATTSKEANASATVLWIYAILSGLYRIVVYGFIGWMILHGAMAMGAGVIGVLFVTILISSLLWKTLSPILRPPKGNEPTLRGFRAIVRVVFLTLLILAALAAPMPRKISAPARIQPAQATQVFLETPGALIHSVDEGTTVRKNEVIAQFRSHQSELDLAATEWEMRRLRKQVESLKKQRDASSDIGQRLPTIKEALSASEAKLSLRETEASRLTVRSPRDGTVYAVWKSDNFPSQERTGTDRWSGWALSAKNVGAKLDPGTLLCFVGHPTLREVEVLVRQQDVSLIEVDAKIEVLTATGRLSGKVISIADSPIKEIDREYFAGGHLEPSLTNPGQTRDTLYAVRARLDPTKYPPPIQSVLRAKIRVKPASLFSRIATVLADSFRFTGAQ